MSEPLTVYQAVISVLGKLPAIEKNGTAPGSMGGFPFRRVEDITAALKPLLAEYGVVIVPTVIQRTDDVRTTANNKALYVVDLLIRFTFYNDVGGSFAAEVWGEGTDSGDKAVQKAVTAAFKSLLTVTFCISDSSDDAEAHSVPETRSTVNIPKHRVDRMRARAAALVAANIPVADERNARGLPLITPQLSDDEAAAWDALLTELEAAEPEATGPVEVNAVNAGEGAFQRERPSATGPVSDGGVVGGQPPESADPPPLPLLEKGAELERKAREKAAAKPKPRDPSTSEQSS